LNFQSVSGLYKNFTRMSPSEFEFLINLIREKNLEKGDSIQESHFCSRKVGTDTTFQQILWHVPQSTAYQLQKCSRNLTTLPIHTTLQDVNIRNEKKGREADGDDVSRCTYTPAQAVTISSLWCNGQILTTHRTSP